MNPGKILIIAGVVLIIAGIIVTFGWRIPFLGRLPGDIRIERDHFSVYFPLTSCILISLLLSLVIWIFRR